MILHTSKGGQKGEKTISGKVFACPVAILALAVPDLESAASVVAYGYQAAERYTADEFKRVVGLQFSACDMDRCAKPHSN